MAAAGPRYTKLIALLASQGKRAATRASAEILAYGLPGKLERS
jgi:hypothetical protein